MAQLSRRLSHNAPGDFFVDASCIDCDTCRWMAPGTFVEREGQASVHTQPSEPGARKRALMALVSCPTGSIGTTLEGRKDGMEEALTGLPDEIDDRVFHNGFHSESSFGAASYLVVRQGGNVLVDSPRFTRPLVRRLEELGGVDFMFLTHRDDVADHEKFREHFGCERILHRDDRTAATRGIERTIEGTEPVELAPDLCVVPTPGHTRGSACLLYRERFLFTGDHIAWSETRGHIYGFRGACWYDWETLVRSTERLLAYSFEWILPGHGRRCFFPRERMADEMKKAVAWMRG